jgi:hypothetical protein
MGVKNLSILLESLDCKPYKKPNPFDSILIDIQSVIHSSLVNSFKITERDIIADVCEKTFTWFVNLLHLAFETKPSDSVKIVLSFDGAGLPMKWPVQRKRRTSSPAATMVSSSTSSSSSNSYSFSNNSSSSTSFSSSPSAFPSAFPSSNFSSFPSSSSSSRKDLLKHALFGHNVVSREIYEYFEERLSSPALLTDTYMIDFPANVDFVLSGSEVSGEGEHKLFHLAKHCRCRNPLVVSVDNDVFVIALVRRRQFETIQVAKGITRHELKNVYDLTDVGVSGHVFASACFLFGNDFVPDVVTIEPANVSTLVSVLRVLNPSHTLPEVVYVMVQRLAAGKKIKFSEVDYFEDTLMVEFWKNCLWVLDYYSTLNFPQKYMTNAFYDKFDRNQFLTACLDLDTLTSTYARAVEEYSSLRTNVVDEDSATANVFDKLQYENLKKYLLATPPFQTRQEATEITWHRN